MTAVALVLVICAVVVGMIRWQKNRAAEAAFEREAEAAAKQMPDIRKKHAEQDRQRAQQFVQAQNCATARSNLKVLEDAAAKGGKVIEFNPAGGASQVNTSDIPGAIYDTQGYLAKNCAGR